MKKTNIARALVLAALPIASQGFGQETVVPGSVSKVSFSLTLSDDIAAAKEKDENGKVVKGGDIVETNEYSVDKKDVRTSTSETLTKIVSVKYTVKEFLTDLTKMEGEGLPLITDIKGWSVVKVQATTNEGELDITPAVFFLSKKGETPISLEGIIGLGSSIKKSGLNLKTSAKFNIVPSEEPEGAPTYTPIEGSETASYSEALKFLGGIYFDLDDTEVELSGVYTGSQKLGSTKGATKLPVILSGAAKLSSLSGAAEIITTVGEGEEAQTVGTLYIVEGSAALGAGAAADLATYPGFEPEPETVE